MRIIWRAYLELLGLEYSLLREDFPAIYDKVRNTPLETRPQGANSVQQICNGIDLAAAFYFKQALCLQRSAATACLLKKHGFPAEMVIGVQQLPFLAHAWVELDGRIVNDKPYVSKMYSVLSRC
jgi:Transglutaminase-like superfamily